jgi:hypothetical protein
MVGNVSTYLNPKVGRIKQYPAKLPGENKVFSKIRMFIICSILWLMTLSAFGLSNHFARLSVSPKEVITGQPFFVKIIVYTPTWFTKAPDFGEYQVNNSFTIRTRKALRRLRNHKWQTIYNVVLRIYCFSFKSRETGIASIKC